MTRGGGGRGGKRGGGEGREGWRRGRGWVMRSSIDPGKNDFISLMYTEYDAISQYTTPTPLIHYTHTPHSEHMHSFD